MDSQLDLDGYNSNFALVIADKVSENLAIHYQATIQTKDYGSDNIEFEWNDPADWADDGAIGEMDIRRYDVKRTRRSVKFKFRLELK